MSEQIADANDLIEQMKLRNEVRGMVDRYQAQLGKLEEEERLQPAKEDVEMTYQCERIKEYRVILDKLQGLLGNLDRTIQKHDEQAKGGT